MHRLSRMDAPPAAPVSRWNLASKGALILVALLLPGGSLILLGMATWRGVKAARSPGEGRSVRTVVTDAVGGLRRAAPRSTTRQQPGSIAA